MNAPLLDYPAYVDRTEPARQRLLQSLAFDDAGSDLEWTVRDVMEELEFLIDIRATMAPEDFLDGVKEQARRLLK